MKLIDKILAEKSGEIITIILKFCADFIHPVSKRIKVSSESSKFFEALVEIIGDSSKVEAEKESEVEKLI